MNMKKSIASLVVSAAVAAFAGAAPAQSVSEISFDSVPNPLKLPPNVYFGEVAGVATNSKGHVFVFSRGNSAQGPAYGAAAAQLFEFDQDGKYVREIGKSLYAWAFAHVVRVDRHDNIWAVDKGSDMVIRFNPLGQVTMVFGRKQEASDEDTAPVKHPNPPAAAEDGRFRQVTDVAWDAQDNIYISDGYINSRVAKADKNGVWLKSWGTKGTEPGQFNTLHSIATDAKGQVYVADRGNRRVQVFDGDGKFLRQFTIDVPLPADARPAIGNKPPANVQGTMAPGAPWALCITPGPNQIMYASDAYPGRVYKLTLDGKLLGMLGRAGKQPKEFGWIHEIACPSENVLYVAELLNWRVQKLILHPGREQASR